MTKDQIQKKNTEAGTTVIIPLLSNVSESNYKLLEETYPSRAWKKFELNRVNDLNNSLWFHPEVDDFNQAITLPVEIKEISKTIQKTLNLAVDARIKNETSFAIELRSIEHELSDEDLFILVRNIAAGLKIGRHPMDLFKSKKLREGNVLNVFVKSSKDSEIKDAIKQGIDYGTTVNSIRTLVNLPSNKKSPVEMAEWLVDSGKKNRYSVEVKEKEALEKEGFHALLAVNRGSEVPAKCLIGEYVPKTKEKLRKIVLVGKGVTFDTGGLSIKGSQNMHYMKSDMGGAAAVMGTIEMVAKLKLQVHLIVVVPTTDNSVDAKSIKPGDVIESYSGKNIEVIDTDAEGRLILADALSYAIQRYNPDYILDLATLTGSVVRALGTEAAGYLTKNELLASYLEEASKYSGENIWRLPLWDEYNEYLKSDIADIRNLGSKPMAGAITAGKFLEAFTHEHPAWGHLDIAGTAFGNFPGSKGYAATGYGVLLLIELIKTILKNGK